jgi:NAD(P)-dependent dehydrogenase (short-subunit alcohol dehydrogenase family)
MDALSGKTIVVSGASRGIGRAHALAVAGAGGNVIGFDLDQQIDGLKYQLATPEDLAETRRQVEELGGRIHTGFADVRDQAAIDSIVAAGVQEFGQIDGAVANAGIWDHGGPLWETDEDLWKTVIDVTLSGSWRVVKATAPYLIENGGGSIVLISSINGVEASNGFGSYVVAKHGIVGLMRQAASELAEHNVRVNAVAPGAIDTPIWNNEMGYGMFDVDDRAGAVDLIYAFGALAGRSALPAAAIANGSVWLLSDLAEHITGVFLPIEAGHLLQPGWNPTPKRQGPEADRYRPPADAPQ